ncbi:MAG: ABC transporter substrate-binding protein [Chloroflexota bacterium]
MRTTWMVRRRQVLGAGLPAAGGVLALACRGAQPGAGPGEAKLGANPATITYAGWGTPREIESVESEIAAFSKKHADLKITVKQEVVPWNGYHEKLQVQAAGGALPDIMLVSSAFFQNLALLQAFLGVGRYFARDKLRWDEFTPGAKDFLTIDGKLYGMPAGGFGVGGAMVTLNKAVFQTTSAALPDFTWTWDDLLARARQITQAGGGEQGPWGVDFGKSTWEAVWEWHLRAYGGSVWNDERTVSTVDTEAAKQTFQFVKDLVDRWNVSHPQPGDPAFDAGQVGMSIAWSGKASTRMSQGVVPVGVATMPRGSAGHGLGRPTGKSHVYTVGATTKEPEAAWRYVKFLVTEREAEQARALSAVAKPGYRPLIEVYFAKIPAHLQEWAKVGQFYIDHTPSYAPLPPAVATRVLPSYDDQMAIISEQLQRFYAGEISVVECVNQMKRLLDARLREVQAAAK